MIPSDDGPNWKLVLALLEIAQEMEKSDKADIRWLLSSSDTIYEAINVLTKS